MLKASLRGTKRLVVLVVGGALLLVGVALLVLPGPGILVIFLGLSVLGSEFAWARHLLRRVRVTSKRAYRNARQRFASRRRSPARPDAPRGSQP